MPVNLTPKALVQTLDALLADGNLSPADAQSLTGGQALSAEQKALVAGRLSESHFTSGAERDQVLGALGMSAADLASSGSSPALLDKVKTKLVELAKSELYKPYDFKVGSFELGEHLGLDLRIKAQLIDGSDPLIAEDKHRAATTQKHQDQGEAITWAIAGGGIYPHAGFSASIPVGPASVSIGFSANAAIGYSVLAPYAHEAQAALDLAKNLSVDLPFSAEKATALEAGTEITLRGTGRVAASSSIGIGYELAKVGDLVSVGASFGSSAGASKELELSLRLKRLDGNKMFVSVSKVDTSAASASIGAHVGVDLNAKSALPDLGGGILAKAGDVAADQIDKQVERWANIDFRATHSTSKSEKEVSSYVIDLSTEAGKSAYEDLLRLDFRKVDQLFADGDLSVSGAKLSDRVRTSGNELKLSFGPITLLRAVSSATKDHVELKAGPKGEETIRVEWERLDAHAPEPSPVAKQIPIEILASGLTVGPEVETYVRERLAKLDRFNNRMLACRVTIEAPTGHHKQGGPFDVSIKIEVPGPDIIVNRQQAKDLHVAIRFAFDAAQRMMEDQVRKMRAEEPRADDRTFGTVARIFPQEGYGFLQAADGHEVYFHRNSVVGAELEALAVGARVRFAEEPGDNGPQATSVVP